MSEPTAQPAQAVSQDLSIIPADSPTGQLIEYLRNRAEEEGPNLALQIAARQLDAMMTATGEEDMLKVLNRESTGGRDLEDTEMSVRSFTVHKATSFKAPLGHFIMIHAAKLSDGEELLFDTSAPLIIGALRWWEAKRMLPKELVIRGAPTPGGRRLWIEPVPARNAPPVIKGKVESAK